MAEYKTFQAWITEGRAVRKGETADFYLVSPDGLQSRAAFSEDQTEPVELIDGIWTNLVPADERPVSKKKQSSSARGGCKLKARLVDGDAQIWVGPNKDAIVVLQNAGFRFNQYTRRWHAKRADERFDQTLQGLVHRRFEVIDERTGEEAVRAI